MYAHTHIHIYTYISQHVDTPNIIALCLVSLVERWNPQSDKLAHFLSDRNTAPSLA